MSHVHNASKCTSLTKKIIHDLNKLKKLTYSKDIQYIIDLIHMLDLPKSSR